MHEFTEHAARVLRSTPTRSLGLRMLYDRVARETGMRPGLSLFIDRLRANPERFALLPGSPSFRDADLWTDAERRSYAHVLHVGGMTVLPVVTLCEAPEERAAAGASAGRACSDATDRLEDVHRSVAELLRCFGHDTELQGVLGAAMASLAPVAQARRHPS